ncbi:uncharacterized protein LOC110735546 [Chenopodium quinoa]|uniref:uncharacterized protein LOC110735546 n=1 Tax=Chenopodium quinoa TaxID=63459 RepID=UPI000B777131|nr:uncharacterized protein LOC110735546 [Chenopodium quinoa]
MATKTATPLKTTLPTPNLASAPESSAIGIGPSAASGDNTPGELATEGTTPEGASAGGAELDEMPITGPSETPGTSAGELTGGELPTTGGTGANTGGEETGACVGGTGPRDGELAGECTGDFTGGECTGEITGDLEILGSEVGDEEGA